MKLRSLVIALLSALALAAADYAAPRFDPKRYLDHVKYLASGDLRGRGSGMPGLDKAANYIARQFHDAGLQPINGKSAKGAARTAGSGNEQPAPRSVLRESLKSYLQPFSVTTNARLGRNNAFHWRDAARNGALTFEQQFVPFNFSAAGTFSCQLVFAGYGITAREYNYDDYAGIDVKDKCAVILRHEPQEYDDKSVFAGKVYTEHSQFFSKASNAKMHGARGVILINDTGNHSADADELEAFAKSAGPNNAGIPFVQIKAETVEQWLTPLGKTINRIQTDIDRDLKPSSFALDPALNVDMTVDVRREIRTVNNVIGYLPGETNEHIVIGAHYDHLGLGEQFSMAPSMAGTPHPGADDNASGTAGVIELARYFASSHARPKRGIVFMAFAGEEIGLLGSSYYVNHPRYPIEQAAAMINMDMIGRIRDHKVYVGGLGTGTTFKPLIEELSKKSDLRLEFSDQTGYGSSDHTSFTTKQVPILFFFSGLHGDYHKPSDTWDKIEATEAVHLLDFIAGLTNRLASGDRPQFVRVEPKPSAHGASAAGSGGGGSGYGPYFGSIPDFAEPPTGVRFSDVREGSPAAKAGLKAGDILIEFDSKPIQNLYDFTYALRSKKAGETVKVKVLRDNKPVEAEVLLEQRR